MWLSSHHLQFKKIKYKDLSQKNISHILSLTERGFDDIIIDGNKTQELLKNRPSNDTMSFSTMTSFILRHSEILKSPIIFDNCHLQIVTLSQVFRVTNVEF